MSDGEDFSGSAEQKLLICLLERVDKLTDELSGIVKNSTLTIDNSPNNTLEARIAVWMHSADDKDMRFNETREDILTTKQKQKIRRKGYWLYEVKLMSFYDKDGPQQYLLSRHKDRFSDSSLFTYHLTY